MDVRTEIREFVKDWYILDKRLAGLDDDASFLENGIVDSTGILELVMFVEDTFGVSVEDEEVVPSNFDSVHRLTEYVTRKQTAQAVNSQEGRRS